MGIVDIVLLVILLLAIIIGLKKGAAGIFFGFFGFLIIGVILGFVVNLTAPYIVFTDKEADIKSTIGEAIYEPVYNMFPSDGMAGDLFHSPIIIDGDTIRLETTIVINEQNIENPSLEQILSSTESVIPEQAFSVVTGFLKLLVKDGQTLAQTLSNMLTIYAVGTVMWIVFAFILTIIKNLIRRKVYKWLDNHSSASKLDRAVGMAITTVIIICILWGAGLFLKVQEDGGQDWAASANTYINENTTIVKGLNESNLFIMILDGETSSGDTSPEAGENSPSA